MKILIADDHILFRDALVQFIERSEEGAVPILARDMHEVMEIMEGAPSLDLILLDYRMPGMDGLKGLEKVRELYPRTPAVLMSGTAEEDVVRKAIDMGAKGYFPKTMSGGAMVNAIHKIMAGETYVPIDHNTNEIMPSYRHNHNDEDEGALPKSGDLAKLTPRETEVLKFLLEGAANKEIARALDLQVVTVKLHVRGICRKLSAKNRTQAALIAQQMGFDPN